MDLFIKKLFFKKLHTCNMLRLYGAGLSYERILTIKSKNRLGSHALGLLPAPISGVVMIVEMNYVFKVGSVSFV